jgi:miniconductance mechanosensitive channel
MADSGGRRIKRDIAIRMESVKFASPRLIEKLQKVKFLSEFVTQRQREIANYNQAHNLTDEQLNVRKQTNIGLFRRYLEYYLKHNESIHQGMTIMVRQLQPTSNGVPIEIYCFTNTIAWLEYEAIQADIFDHIFAVVNEFELQIHENPSGADMRAFVDSKTV